MGLDEGWLSRVQSAGLEATDRDTQIHVERSQLTEGLYSRAYIYVYMYTYIFEIPDYSVTRILGIFARRI